MIARRMGMLCLVLLLALLLAGSLLVAWPFATSAASIVQSKHDLAWWRDVKGYHPWDDFQEVCVYCHTPHHANATQGALWNRPASTATFTLYQSPTLDNPASQPGPGSMVCMSCHDGTIAMDAIVNRPQYQNITHSTYETHGRMTTDGTDAWENCGVFCHGGTNSHGWGGFEDHWFADHDLSKDHPVGIVYPTSSEFVPAPPGGKFPNGVRLVNGRVECISCHDPHNPSIQPFLVTADSGSALCYTCHVK